MPIGDVINCFELPPASEQSSVCTLLFLLLIPSWKSEYHLTMFLISSGEWFGDSLGDFTNWVRTAKLEFVILNSGDLALNAASGDSLSSAS